MLKRAWQAWKTIAHKIGNFRARILLTLFYAVLVFPFGIVVRLFSDPLRIKRHTADPRDAIRSYFCSGVDALIIDNFAFSKAPIPSLDVEKSQTGRQVVLSA
jgi:hypothetical protein